MIKSMTGYGKANLSKEEREYQNFLLDLLKNM